MIYQDDFTLRTEYLEQLSEQGTEYLSELIRILVNAAMQSERQKHLRAGWHERTPERQGHANARTLSLAVALKYAVARLPRRMSALSEPTRRGDDTVLASSLRRSPMWRQRHVRTLHKPDDVGRASRPIRSVLECSPTFKPSAPLQHRANSTSAHNPQAR